MQNAVHKRKIAFAVNDIIVERVINDFKTRSEIGLKKYGTTLMREDYSLLYCIEESQKEAMDFVLYLEAMKEKYNKDLQK